MGGNRDPNSDRDAGSSSTSNNDVLQGSGKPDQLECMICSEFFNEEKRVPRCLPCGHTVCTDCLRVLMGNGTLSCPYCRKDFFNIKSLEDVAVNYSLLDLVIRNSTPAEKSPHGSNCLEVGVAPTLRCTHCQKWVCDKCGSVDHQKRRCFLIPLKDAMLQMKEAGMNEAKAAGKGVSVLSKRVEEYKRTLDNFCMSMQLVLNSAEKEKERVTVVMKEGKEKKVQIDTALSVALTANTLPDLLSLLPPMEELSRGTNQWVRTEASKSLDHKRALLMTKQNLLSAIQMQMFSDSSAGTSTVFLTHTAAEVPMYAQFMAEGRRLHIYSLKKDFIFPKDSQFVPLSSIMPCVDNESALTFLDIGWDGIIKGRVYIRLLGDTLRGRQFLLLCLGETGHSFHNTNFHRIWWRGQAGESIWGGDYSKGDGSGAASILRESDKKNSTLIPARCLHVKAGLVVGRYEKTNLSSVFRIYMRESDEVTDETAFGHVESGLHVLEAAVQHKDIRSVTIYNCGIVIEE